MERQATIEWNRSGEFLIVIDQRVLPHELRTEEIRDVDGAIEAIADMHVRGAPLIGAVAAYGAHFAIRTVVEGKEKRKWLAKAIDRLRSARPTAVNLNWAVDRVLDAARSATTPATVIEGSLAEAHAIMAEELERSRRIGEHGLSLIERIAGRREGPVNILTHCNAGRLACIDYGTATAPVYRAHEAGIDVHVWVDETRPRNQGARLTAWELREQGVPCTIVADNVGGHLMQNDMVDLVIVGTDRTTRNGDVVNKIGTYLKALAAKDNDIPFYVAAPSSSIDLSIEEGSDVPIELRDAGEVHFISGLVDDELVKARITPDHVEAGNYAFDVTPASLVTGLITEHGVCPPGEVLTFLTENGRV